MSDELILPAFEIDSIRLKSGQWTLVLKAPGNQETGLVMAALGLWEGKALEASIKERP